MNLDPQIPDRYEHNPLLALVENYVLAAINKLEPDNAQKLNAIVCRTFGGTDWRATLRDQLNLPPDTDDTLRLLWTQRQEEAAATQQDLSPEQFAQSAADDLFSTFGGT